MIAAKVPLLLALLVVASLGCRSASHQTQVPATDRPLARESQKASDAFHAGYDDEAIVRYRTALARAWELDDSAAIATAAFNLAAASAATDNLDRARQALAETRAELDRQTAARHPHTLAHADVWLLEAKVARAEGRLADAAYYADCLAQPAIACAPECNESCCQSKRRCWRSCLQDCRTRLAGCFGRDDPPPDRCDQAAVALGVLRANLAIDSGDWGTAQTQLACVKQAAAGVNDPATCAEIAAVEARLLLQLEDPAAAARRLDQEAIWLRQSGHLREIPRASAAAAEAFLAAGQLHDAADRYLRTARILYGRGELLAALHFLERSVEWSVQLEDVDLQLRAELLLDEIEAANGNWPAGEAITAEEFEELAQARNTAW